jgi:drug/metabolite transporter (DMT)-like permease
MSLGTLWTGVGSLVLGFFSIGVLGILGGAVGLVLGMVTLRRVGRGTATGSDTATFGMALSLVSIAIGSVLLISAWPMLVDAFEQGWEQGTRP